MTQEQRQKVAVLNAKYFTEFGVMPDGRLKFQWMRTDEMPVEFGRGMSVKEVPGQFLVQVVRDYKKRTVADLYGHGLCWTVAKLEPPVSYDQWLREYGTNVAWPVGGYYRPIDNIVRHIDLLPDEEVTARAAFNLRNHLQYEYKDWVEMDEKEQADIRAAKDKRLEDMIDDAVPAFMNNPGGKGHVSLPTVTKGQPNG